VLDADIEAAFDNVSHTAVMDRVRARVKDKRVLALVKAFLKAGVLTELGEHCETITGTPQGGILSPLIFNIALSALDEHLAAPWEPGGSMSTEYRRAARRRKGLPSKHGANMDRNRSRPMWPSVWSATGKGIVARYAHMLAVSRSPAEAADTMRDPAGSALN
jgi:reverse transcriptase-like protein